MLGLTNASAQAEAPKAGLGEHGAYAKPDGETFFVLSLEVAYQEPASRGVEVLVLFDTSASQTAVYRDKSLAALDDLLADLAGADRVNLMAVDVQAVPMTDGFVAPQGPEMKQALTKLRLRTPLGATDMGLAMTTAAEVFAKAAPAPELGRSTLYLGDGVSAANLLAPPDALKHYARLVDQKVPFNSYAIGPRRDIELLGAIANHTGGILVVDYPDKPAKGYARDLANIAHGHVFWPKQSKLPGDVVEVFPKIFPPLRGDRETILIGRGRFPAPFPVEATVEAYGQSTLLTWTIEPRKPQEDHAPLADLVTRCRPSDGAALPTCGKAALVEIYRVLDKNIQSLTKLAETALATKNADQAIILSRRILELDPKNLEAQAILGAAEKLKKGVPDAPTPPDSKLKLGPKKAEPPASGPSKLKLGPSN